MSRYIDADLYKNVFEKLNHRGIFPQSRDVMILRNYLDEFPTADVIENKVLRLLLDWAIECGFGYDSIPEEYEKYKDDIQDKNYAEGLIYIAMKEAEENE